MVAEFTFFAEITVRKERPPSAWRRRASRLEPESSGDTPSRPFLFLSGNGRLGTTHTTWRFNMTSRKASIIAPHRTSGVQPHVAAGAAPAAPVAGRRPDPLSAAHARLLGSLDAQLVNPTIKGDDAAVVAHVGSSRIALPSGTRVAAGARGIIYVLVSDELHILTESRGAVRELLVDDLLASQIVDEHFGA